MRILYINQTSIHGGAEEILLHVMTGIIGKGHNPFLIVPSTGWLTDKCTTAGIPYKLVPTIPTHTTRNAAEQSRNVFLNNLSLSGITKQLRADVIHVNSPRLAYHAGLAAIMTRRPLIVHVHDIVDSPYLSCLKSIYLSIVSSATIPVSDAVKDVVCSEHSQPDTTRIYNGVDLSIYHNINCKDVRPSYGINEEDLLIGSISAMTPWKGQDTLIQAFPEVLKEFPHAKLLIGGGARNHPEERKHENTLKQMCRQLIPEDKVVFTGWTEKAVEIIKSVDIFVHTPTRPDPFPTVIIHAMSLGKAIIASKTGGIPEMTCESEGAVLVEPGNATALSRAMLELSRDAKRRNAIAESALSLSFRFNKQRMVDEVIGVYNRLGHQTG